MSLPSYSFCRFEFGFELETTILKISLTEKKSFEVYAYNDPLLVMKEFKPHFYDLILADIYIPNMDGFQLCEKILGLDVNIRVCFMSVLAIKIQALREVYRNVGFGSFIKKPVTKYLIKRLSAELD